MALETVLVAVGPRDADRYERLGEEAIEIAGPAGATVVLGHVFTEEEYDQVLDRLEFDPEREEVSADDVAQRHSTVRELGRMLDRGGVDYVVRGAVGDHGERIVRIAEETDADLVLVSGRKRSPTGKAVFGSTAQEVMLSSPCPVTFVREDTR
ncbi:MAG: universal stress protein [Haloferacaceae archaeon]